MYDSKISGDSSIDFKAMCALQSEQAGRREVAPLPVTPRFVAGVDAAFHKPKDLVFAALVILLWPEMKVVETVTAVQHVTIPYVPGFLSFRELPVISEAWERCTHPVDFLVCDGQGTAHPRGFGLACHAGMELDIPSFGCGKSRLYGSHAAPGPQKGAFAKLRDEKRAANDHIGYVLRTRTDVKPVYVSAGHRCTQESAREWCLKLTTRYKLPEPTRLADKAVSLFKKEWLAENFG